ncbi:MAG: Gfo/Idh/MocA family oxidoreductase [Caldilineaceae bacterium]|nr:Gfo/Idh/MocA family oxidoreductase [Caldilineaceae bacterium]
MSKHEQEIGSNEPFSGPPVRLALVGAGIFARDAHVPSLLRLPDRFRIVAVYSRTHQAAAALAEEVPGTVAVFTDLDALIASDEVEAST